MVDLTLSPYSREEREQRFMLGYLSHPASSNIPDGSPPSRSTGSALNLALKLMIRVTLVALSMLISSSHTAYAQDAVAKETRAPLEIDPQALSLTQLTECGRLHNPALKIAQAELEKMRGLLMSARGNRFPSLSVDSLLAPLPARRLLKYCVDETQISAEGLPRVIPCPNQAIQDDARLGDTDGMGIYTRTTATLTQPLYTFGKISAGIRAAEKGIQAHEALNRVATYQLDPLAAQTYYGLLLAERAQRVFRKGRRQLKKMNQSISKELKKESGKYTTNDLRRLKIKESELSTLSEEVNAQKRLAVRGVQLSCQLKAEQEIKLDARKLKPLTAELLKESVYLQQALNARPEVHAARAQVEARRAQRDLTISRFFPDIALIATFAFARGTSAEDNPDPFASDPFNVFGYGAYLGLRWRLDLGQINAKLKSAEVSVARAEADLNALTLQISLEVNERYQEVLRHQRTLEIRREAMVSGKQWMTSEMLNLNAGLSTSQDSLAAITAYFQTSLNYDRTVYEYNLALIRLWLSVGRDPLTLLSLSPPNQKR